MVYEIINEDHVEEVKTKKIMICDCEYLDYVTWYPKTNHLFHNWMKNNNNYRNITNIREVEILDE